MLGVKAIIILNKNGLHGNPTIKHKKKEKMLKYWQATSFWKNLAIQINFLFDTKNGIVTRAIHKI